LGKAALVPTRNGASPVRIAAVGPPPTVVLGMAIRVALQGPSLTWIVNGQSATELMVRVYELPRAS
jgi:hypothetical protein